MSNPEFPLSRHSDDAGLNPGKIIRPFLDSDSGWIYLNSVSRAGIAQLAEQLIRNQQAVGSNPIPGSSLICDFYLLAKKITI
jgi:hypothetical protein